MRNGMRLTLMLGVCLVVPLRQAQAQSLPSLEAGLRSVETAEQKAEKARKAARAQAAREKATREQAAREKAAQEKAAREQAARQAEVRRQAEQEMAALRAKNDANNGLPALKVFRDTLKDGSAGPEMVVIPAGSFKMGSSVSEKSSSDNERPVHTVTLQRFAIGKYEVKFTEYEVFAEATGQRLPEDDYHGRDNHPMVSVSWESARLYTQWLSEQTGEHYRLLSEAEWEYASRAGTRGPFSFKGKIDPDKSNYDHAFSYDGSSVFPRSMFAFQLHTRDRTGSLPPNPWGIHEVHGNVAEWTEDCWHASYSGAPTDGSAWVSGCDTDSQLVIRGGYFGSDPAEVRSAARDSGSHNSVATHVGFRLARDL